MAIGILRTCIAHDVHHNLEFFFWLLIWVVLRYTSHSHRCGPDMFVKPFGPHTQKSSAAAKNNFLATSQDWKVLGNEPLNTLITIFRDLVADQKPPGSGTNPRTPVYLAYESVVA